MLLKALTMFCGVFVPRQTLLAQSPLQCALAVIPYNDGYMKLNCVFQQIGIVSGINASKEFHRRDKLRIYNCEYKLTSKQRTLRQSERKRRLDEQDRYQDREGTVYESGGF